MEEKIEGVRVTIMQLRRQELVNFHCRNSGLEIVLLSESRVVADGHTVDPSRKPNNSAASKKF